MIETQGSQLALVLLAGVQYYTGQRFDMQQITEVGHRVVSVAFCIIMTQE